MGFSCCWEMWRPAFPHCPGLWVKGVKNRAAYVLVPSLPLGAPVLAKTRGQTEPRGHHSHYKLGSRVSVASCMGAPGRTVLSGNVAVIVYLIFLIYFRLLTDLIKCLMLVCLVIFSPKAEWGEAKSDKCDESSRSKAVVFNQRATTLPPRDIGNVWRYLGIS